MFFLLERLHTFFYPTKCTFPASQYLRLVFSPHLDYSLAIKESHDDHDHDHDDDHKTSTKSSKFTTAEKWGYAVLANSFLVLLAVVGILSVKCSDERSRLYVTDIFLGLAVSTMLGDSILHIIPIFLGIHKHEEEGHEGK